MQEGSDRSKDENERPPEKQKPDTRPQQAGDGATTRFGMEEGDNTDISQAGAGLLEDEEEEGSPEPEHP